MSFVICNTHVFDRALRLETWGNYTKCIQKSLEKQNKARLQVPRSFFFLTQ